MKRFAAILLLGVLLFNWCGYRLLSSWLEDRADRQLESRLDNNSYDESQLLSFKVPSTHLSYYNSSQQFERVDGQIEIGGVKYKYVKRRLYNDSVELLCIPNQSAMQLRTAKNEFFRLVNDLQHNGQGKKADSHSGSSWNPTSSEYFPAGDLFALGSLYFTSMPMASYRTAGLSTVYFCTAEQPPDLFSTRC